MKASMKKELLAIQAQLNLKVAQVQELLDQEESYAADLTNDDKIEESEGRQELLQQLGEVIEAASETINDLLS